MLENFILAVFNHYRNERRNPRDDYFLRERTYSRDRIVSVFIYWSILVEDYLYAGSSFRISFPAPWTEGLLSAGITWRMAPA